LNEPKINYGAFGGLLLMSADRGGVGSEDWMTNVILKTVNFAVKKLLAGNNKLLQRFCVI
jgi:hypothetical protein